MHSIIPFSEEYISMYVSLRNWFTVNQRPREDRLLLVRLLYSHSVFLSAVLSSRSHARVPFTRQTGLRGFCEPWLREEC